MKSCTFCTIIANTDDLGEMLKGQCHRFPNTQEVYQRKSQEITIGYVKK